MTSQMDSSEYVAYCGRCKRVLEVPGNRTDLLPRLNGRGFLCKGNDRTHIAAIVKGKAAQLWLRVESRLAHYEAHCSPMRCLQRCKVLPQHNAGAYLLFRLFVLLLLLVVPWFVTQPPHLALRLVTFAVSIVFIGDIVVVNTVTALIRRSAANSLRSDLFLVISFGELAVAFSVLYLALCDAFSEQHPVRVLYSSVVTMATAGLAEIKSNTVTGHVAAVLVIVQILITFYFVALLVATVIATPSVINPKPTLEQLIEEIARDGKDSQNAPYPD